MYDNEKMTFLVLLKLISIQNSISDSIIRIRCNKICNIENSLLQSEEIFYSTFLRILNYNLISFKRKPLVRPVCVCYANQSYFWSTKSHIIYYKTTKKYYKHLNNNIIVIFDYVCYVKFQQIFYKSTYINHIKYYYYENFYY